MRLFVALEIPDSIREALAGLQGSLAQTGIRDIRWVDPRGIHLTLRFCGEVSDEMGDRIAGCLTPGPVVSPFRVSLGGWGLFPPRGLPRVLWVGARSEGSLAPLAAWVEERMVIAGLSPEGREFHPHLTLGRFRPGTGRAAPAQLARMAPPELGEMTVNSIVLFESKLGSGRPRYLPVREYPFRGGAVVERSEG